MSDSPKEKKPDKPLTATQRLRNMVYGLLDAEPSKRHRMTQNERSWLEELRTAIDESKIGDPEAKKILEQDEDRFLAIVGRGITKKDIGRTRQMINRIVDEHEARLDWEAGGPEWRAKAKKKTPPDSGHLM